MKTFTILISIIFCFITINCIGPQKSTGIEDAAAPNNTSTIINETNMNAETAYRSIAQILQNRGYTFRTTDETLKSISTEFSGITQRWGVDHTFTRIGISIQGDTNAKIFIRGWMKTIDNESDQTGQRIRKHGQSGSPVRNAWIELFEIASEIEGHLKFE